MTENCRVNTARFFALTFLPIFPFFSAFSSALAWTGVIFVTLICSRRRAAVAPSMVSATRSPDTVWPARVRPEYANVAIRLAPHRTRSRGARSSSQTRSRHDPNAAVDRLRRRVRVQRAERQVAGLGDAERRFDRLEIAHLADEHDVRVLAERRAERVAEAVGVAVHLALVHQTVLVLMHELDRVLDGQDVIVALGVDLVDHRRQRRRLAAAGRAGDEHQAARLLRERREHGRQAQIAERANLFRDDAVDGADGPA